MAAEAEEVPTGPHNVIMLDLVRELQLQHGLRAEDYCRYRRYCSKRIRRLRNGMGMGQNEEFGTKKKRHKYLKRDVTEELYE
eukprot:gene15897-668_t